MRTSACLRRCGTAGSINDWAAAIGKSGTRTVSALPFGIDLTAVMIAPPTARSTSSPSDACGPTKERRTTSLAGSPKDIPNSTPYGP